MSGPLAGLFGVLPGEMSACNGYLVFLDDTRRQRILRGLFDSYYAECTTEVVVDTTRGWPGRIARLFPDAKVVACVRDLAWVMDSIKRLVQRNVFRPSLIFNGSAGGTVYTGASGVVGAHGMVGAPYDAPTQACYGVQCENLMLVQYESLTTDPATTMHTIYALLGEPAFVHDFAHTDCNITEFDERAGTPGLHTVCGPVKAEPRETVLAPDLFNRLVADAFWCDPHKIPAGLRVV